MGIEYSIQLSLFLHFPSKLKHVYLKVDKSHLTQMPQIIVIFFFLG